MSEAKWSSEETYRFIEIYRNEPAIWNPKNKYHKDKNPVNDAWKRIADAISIPTAELKRKKETLMAAFRMNHKKVLASIKSGAGEEDIFKPIWIYYDVLAAFLTNVYECKSILNTEDEEFLENEGSNPNESQENYNQSVQSSVQIPVQRRRSQRPVELQETQAQMNTALTTLNNVLSNTKKKDEREDDSDLYGRLLAKKLKSFSEIERQEIMYEIDGLLLKKRHRTIVSTESPSQIILSRPSSSRSMYTSCSRPSSTNASYSNPSTPLTPAQSMDSIKSPPNVINQAPSPIMYVPQSQQSPQIPILQIPSPTTFPTVSQETYYETQSQDILSQACYDAELNKDY